MLLFVARNTALAFFVCKWLVYPSGHVGRSDRRPHSRAGGAVRRRALRACASKAAGARRRLSLGSAGKCEYALVVVDEAHHLAGEPKLHEQLKTVRAAEATLLFLSDASQATGATPDAEKLARSLVNLPRDQAVAVATLSEVVRSTKRIVAGAAAFQLDAGRKAEMSTYTASPGPPLVARIFPVEDDTDEINVNVDVIEFQAGHVSKTRQYKMIRSETMRVRSSKQLRPYGANSRTWTIWMTGSPSWDPTTRLLSGSADR